jgi:hypothetical protein
MYLVTYYLLILNKRLKANIIDIGNFKLNLFGLMSIGRNHSFYDAQKLQSESYKRITIITILTIITTIFRAETMPATQS